MSARANRSEERLGVNAYIEPAGHHRGDEPSVESLRARLRRLNLYGLATHAEEIIAEPWLARVLEVEDCERQRRSLKRRTDNARLGAFKPLPDFDYAWPKEIDRVLLEELFTFAFLEQAANKGWARP